LTDEDARESPVAGPELESELIEYCRGGIAHYKCPRSVDCVNELPRTETGKMAKRELRAKYWEGHDGQLV
jgi:acyl-coenzyme A synthetase/AMP-(fatty) acid ligase